ncbi:hypothetical protein B0H17DRAFT_1178558 [Mycena rosella]|uniref:F-box domain-containing protein n=1 Tax=Mycena rosella TaxID=1033263 RepID=A0AAD7DM31_MYCRO|nr:hypothetical protein B0H17DRAFT_1178558 [Mycena rosella]
MSSVALLPPGLPVQELWDQIIDLLDQYRDLKSCALVSRSFRPRAQHQLFHHVTFKTADCTSGVPGDKFAACLRLVSILVTSPHLQRHIRHISLPFSCEILAHVCGMRLSRLREIEFLQTDNCPSADDPSFGFAHDLIARPSVRRVRIDVRRWSFEDGAGLSPSVLSRIFQSPAPHLQHLAFNLGNSRIRGAPATPQLACTHRAQIKSLNIMFSPEIGDYLIHPACPFDLSRLEDVQISSSMTPAVEQVLEIGRFTIKRLECSADDLAWGLGLNRFPYLAHLTIIAYGSELPDVINGLAAASSNCIESLILLVPVDMFENWAEKDDIARLDTILSSSAMPALQKAEIRFNKDDGSIEEHLTTRNVLRSSFPKLHVKGVLEVPRFDDRVMFWLWPQAKKPRLFGFGTKAKAKPKFWPELAVGLAS